MLSIGEQSGLGRRALSRGLIFFLLVAGLPFCWNGHPEAQSQEVSPQETERSQPEVASGPDLAGQPNTNFVVIELFYRSDSEQSQNAKIYLEGLQARRAGIKVKTYDVLKDKQQLARLWQLSKRFGREQAGLPSFYLVDSLKVGFQNPETRGVQIEELLNVKAYIRPGCGHCHNGKLFLESLAQRWPAIKVEYFDVTSDINARNEMQRLATEYRVQVPSFPLIQIAGRVVVGFQSAEITGKQMESWVQDRSVNFGEVEPAGKESEEKSDKKQQDSGLTRTKFGQSDVGSSQWSDALLEVGNLTQPVFMIKRVGPDKLHQDKVPANGQQDDVPEEILLPEEVQLPDESQLPDELSDSPIIIDEVLSDHQTDSIETAWFGRLSVSKLGLPLFTFLIGLIDGFNPCAMWVLVFLLSVLVSIKERTKILLVAGTFIIVSGLAYFLFMTAWFNVFQLIGLLRPVQIGLGVVAIVFGLINVKDFFAFHQGLTLSIPESAKPGIYRRVRNIVTANQLTTAVSGAIVLAIVVNIVELLCTAGLPALYTQILAMHALPVWKNYAYLALYISAYMLDDTILVGIVVTTLSNRRLQESEGRWLKLLSGLIILLLGVVMIFCPEALV